MPPSPCQLVRSLLYSVQDPQEDGIGQVAHDISISALGAPYVVFPVLAGYPLGLFDTPWFFTYLIISLLGAVGVGTMEIFENRYYVLFGQGTWWEKVTIPYLIFANILAPVFILPSMLVVPDQDAAFLEVSRKLPCTIPPILHNRKMFIVATDMRLPFICCASISTWNFAQGAFFSITLLIRLFQQRRKSSVTSSRTNDLQKKFAIALSLQSVLPFTVLQVPIAYMFYSVFMNYYNQLLNCLMLCFISVHGLLSTVIMISVHQPYRNFVLTPIYRLFSKKSGSSRSSINVSRLSIVVIQ